MAHMVMNTANALKVTPNMIPGIMQELAISADIGRLPMEFTPSTDVFSIFLTENNAATLAGRQPLSYWLLTDDAFLAPWLPPEVIGGLVQFVKEDIMLAADDQRKDALTLVNGLSKTFEKIRFFRRREHWIMAWRRAFPILITSGQWTFVSWLTHFNHICMLYELNKDAGNDHLITWYEDRVRKHWSDKCARGDMVDLVVECGRTRRTIMDMCKAKLHHVLAAAGLQQSQASYQHSASSDIAASAMAKQQAMLDADSKRQKNLASASKQMQEYFDKKVDALQQARPSEAAGQFSKSWSNKTKGRGKGKSKGGQSSGKGKSKKKVKRKSSWNKVDLKSNKEQSQW